MQSVPARHAAEKYSKEIYLKDTVAGLYLKERRS
jgi:hypothetical protein